MTINPETLTPEEIKAIFPDSNLTIKDKLPLNMMLFLHCLAIQKASMNINVTEEMLVQAVSILIADIPKKQHDEQFQEDLNNAYYEIIVDVRPEFCTTKISVEYCNRKGIPTFIKEKKPHYIMMYTACINVMDRKHMLTKKESKQLGDFTFPEEK